MSTNIKLKRSAVAGRVPQTSDLELGELAINTYDGKLYLKKDDGTQAIVDVSSGLSASEILTLLQTVDGSGSGLDADTVDGIQAASFLRSDAVDILDAGNQAIPLVIRRSNASASQVGIQFDIAETDNRFFGLGADGNPYWATNANLTNGFEIWHAGNDGAGSGLDADLLDGLNSTQFLRSDADATTSANLTVAGYLRTEEIRADGAGNQLVLNAGESFLYATGQTSEFLYINAENGLQINSSLDNWTTGWAARVVTEITSSGITWNGNTVWHAGNDGSGSGLDADTLDGQQGSYYLDWTNTTNKPDPTLTLAGDATGSATFTNLGNATLTVTIADDSHNHIISNVDGLQTALDAKLALAGGTMTGDLLFGDNDKAIFGAGSDLQIYHDGSNSYIQDAGTGNLFVQASNVLWLRSATGTAYLSGTAGNEVAIYHNGSEKLRTTTTGIDVTGTITATSFSGPLTGNASTASTWQTARTITLGGVLSGSVSIDGSANVTLTAAHTSDPVITLTGAVTGSGTMTNLGSVSIATTATADPTLTLAGDATGSATFTNLGNATLTVTVADDSHNHSSSTGNFTVGGDLIVNGTTFTVNATTVSIDDPIITLGGDTVPAVDDNKDRGIEFRWHNGTAAKIGFFGFDDSTGYLTFIPDATNTSEVFSGTAGDIQATNFRGALIGNATTATTLQTARTIGGVSFNGSANINLPGVNTTGNQNTTGSAATLTTARAIQVSGAVTGTANFDGSAAINIVTTATADPTLTLAGDATGSATFTNLGNATLTVAIVDNSHSHTVSNISDFTTGANTAIDNRVTKSFVDALNVDADTVDGIQAASFLRSDAADSWNSTLTYTGTVNSTALDLTNSDIINVNKIHMSDPGEGIHWTGLNSSVQQFVIDDANDNIMSFENVAEIRRAGNKVWDAGNDGAGSGLDADLLDGQQGTYYQPASTAVTTTTITNHTLNPRFATTIGFGNDTEILRFNDGTNETRSGYWTSKDGFYIQGDGNNVDAVVLKTGNLELSQNGYVTGTLGVAGNINVGTTASIEETSTTLTTTSQTVIGQWSTSTYSGGKYLIQATRSGERHITEILITHNGTTAVATEYGSIWTSSSLATYEVDISGGNFRILATGTSSTSTVYKILEIHLI